MRFRYLLSPISFVLTASPLIGASEGLSKKTIEGVVTANQDQVHLCYQRASTKIPGLSGKFRVEIRVSKSGSVESTKVRDSNFSSPAVESCVEGKIKSWTFVAPLPNQPNSFSLPFSFGSGQRTSKSVTQVAAGAPQTINDSQIYKGHVFKKSNRAIEDPKVLEAMAKNSDIKAKADNCENIRVLKEKCEDLEDKNRVVCSGLIESAPRKPSTSDWTMIVHPDAFRIVSGVYFLGYWHVACKHVKDL